MPEQIETTKSWIVEMGPKIMLAAAVFIVAFLIYRLLIGAIKRMERRLSLDPTIASLVCNMLGPIILISALVVALDVLGISTTGLVAALGAGAVAIGLALKDSLGNLAAGVVLLISRPCAVEDIIETEELMGVVIKIDLLHTVLRTFDNRQISIPNVRLIGNPITNYSREENRRLDLTFFLDYKADLTKAMEILKTIRDENPHVLREPEARIGMRGCGETSVQMALWVWCRRDDYLTLQFELNESVKAAFDREGIPFAYRRHHIYVSPENEEESL